MQTLMEQTDSAYNSQMEEAFSWKAIAMYWATLQSTQHIVFLRKEILEAHRTQGKHTTRL